VIDSSCKEANSDRLAPDRRPRRESEADGDEQRSWVNPNACLDPAAQGSQAPTGLGEKGHGVNDDGIGKTKEEIGDLIRLHSHSALFLPTITMSASCQVWIRLA
jgi:hypothetical protein